MTPKQLKAIAAVGASVIGALVAFDLIPPYLMPTLSAVAGFLLRHSMPATSPDPEAQ